MTEEMQPVSPVITEPVLPPVVHPTPIAPIMPTPKKSPWPLILSLLLVATLATAGYFYWQNTQLKSQLTAVPTPTASPTGYADSMAGWQAYTDTNGFKEYSFSHPEDWVINKEEYNTSDAEWKGYLLTIKNQQYIIKIDFPNTIFPETCIFDDQKNLPKNEMANDCSGEFNTIGTNMRRLLSPTKLENSVNWVVYTKSQDQYVGLPPISIEAPVNYDSKKIELIDQILATFKFASEANDDIVIRNIIELTKPAVWSEPKVDTILDGNKVQISGLSMSTNISAQDNNTVVSLLSWDSPLVTQYKWTSIPSESGVSLDGGFYTFKKDQQKLIIRSNADNTEYRVLLLK